MRTATPRSLVELDHPMLRVRDLDAARIAYQRLGFTVTPKRTNDPMGGGSTGGRGGNHLVMLTPQTPRTTNMLELAYADPQYAWPRLRSLLSGPEGLALLVHTPVDAEAIHKEWEEAGIACDPVFEVKRQFTDAETGHQDLIHFRVAQPANDDWTYSFGAAQILDFNHYLRKDWCTHDNGALYWSEITLIVPQQEMPAGIAHLAKVYGMELRPDPQGIVKLQIEKLTLRLLPLELAETVYSGIPLTSESGAHCNTALTIKVSDLKQLSALLESRQVAIHASPSGAIGVAPSDACGVLIEFVEA